MNEDLDLLNIELCMLECAEDNTIFFTESKIEDFGTKITNGIKKIIDYMVQYVKNLKADIMVFGAKQATRAKALQLRTMVRLGVMIEMPNIDHLSVMYKETCVSIMKDMNDLLKEISNISVIGNNKTFLAKKGKFEKNLRKREIEYLAMLTKTGLFQAKVAETVFDGLMHGSCSFIDAYYDTIKKLMHFCNECERKIKILDREPSDGSNYYQDYNALRTTCSVASTMLSKLLRKSVSAIWKISLV